jgi:putative ABC transport system ATP-binding protein
VGILELRGLRKAYRAGLEPVEAVRGVDLSVAPGDFIAIMGPSGCGKSTLLHLCGAMDRPTSGRIELEGRSLQDLDEDRLTALRRGRIGFVFQFFNLLPTLSALENIALPLQLAGVAIAEAEQRARALAERVGIAHRSRHYPQQLSGGEMQRAAIARAIVHSPALLIADEPTGNLDSENGALILELLAEVNRDTGVAILLATHDPEIAAAAHRIIRMRDGRFEDARAAERQGAAGKVDPVAPL